MTTSVLITAGLAVLALFFASSLAMAEASLSRIDAFRAQAWAEEHRKGARALSRVVASPEVFAGYLNSILLLRAASQVAGITALTWLLIQLGNPVLLVGGVVVEVVVTYVLAEALPRTLAVQHADRSALLTAPFISGIGRVIPMRAVTRGLIAATNALLPGRGLKQGPFVYEQQILALVDRAAKESAIEAEEHELIHSVIEFGTTVVREVMVPRTDMEVISSTSTVSEGVDVVIDKGLSRVPVHADGNEEVVGILFAKDLMRAEREGFGDENIARLVRAAPFIPETKRVNDLLREMQLQNFHMAIAVDEYGSVVGLVTLEDLVEELVGDIRDEYDRQEQPRVETITDNEWLIDARMSIDEIESELSLSFPHGDWDTVGGLLINAFGRVPGRGEEIDVEGRKFVVEQISGRRVTRVRVCA